MYLTGFTIFLSLILNRTYILILEQLRLEEEVKRLRGDKTGSGKNSAKLAEAGGAGEISGLKRELAKKDAEIQALLKQTDGLHKEYIRLGDEKSPVDPVPKKDR